VSETLNIISESYNERKTGGPYKVIINTLKGLDRIGYPYVLNKNLLNYRHTWIHDSSQGLIEIALRNVPGVVGPNIAVLPSDLPALRPSLGKCIYLHPSKWCVDVWKLMDFKECPLYSWPAGIDTDNFNFERRNDISHNVMVYWKRRDPVLLDQVLQELKRMGFLPKIIKCGEYSEEQFKMVMSTSVFGVWLGTSESQGIALQEALASNLPLIVCDVQSLFEAYGKHDYAFPKRLKNFKPTSAPYFDERCGIIINDFSSLGKAIREISNNISYYKPREYVIENLSLEKQANELLSLFDILRDRNKEYFLMHVNYEVSGYFKISLKGKFIYLIFVLRRKFKTFLRLVSNKFRK
jgi:hypothetical protein